MHSPRGQEAMCGRVESYEVCVDWNHKNPSEKPKDVPGNPLTISTVCVWNQKVPVGDWMNRIDGDRARCEMLCANCHQEHTSSAFL